MRNLFLACTFALLAVGPATAKQLPQTCKAKFGFAYTDKLDNDYRGIQGKELKEIQKKLTKYGDVCYTAEDSTADYIFYVHTKPAVYHGTRTVTSTSTHTDSSPIVGAVTDENGERSRINGTVDTTTTTKTSSSVPEEVAYEIYTLDIMVPNRGEHTTYTRLHSFEQKSLHNAIYGIEYGKGNKPIISVIDTAAKWLHENNPSK